MHRIVKNFLDFFQQLPTPGSPFYPLYLFNTGLALLRLGLRTTQPCHSSPAALRIAISSTAFTLAHLNNLGGGFNNYAKKQIVTALAIGVVAGVCKESSLGLPGVIGMHIAHNLMGAIQLLKYVSGK